MDVTTIKLDKKTKERLERFRSYKRESYDEILQKIFEIMSICRVEPEKARAKLVVLERQNKTNSKK